MVLAPESELVPELTSAAQKAEVDEYLEYVKKRTELERMSDRKVTGCLLRLLCHQSVHG